MMKKKVNEGDRPVLNGLVLAGGRSVRMGQDKGALHWHGEEQRIVIADLLARCCDAVFISCRPDQCADIQTQRYRSIPDVVENSGPVAGILSAFNRDNSCAWLVVACDLPLLDYETILQLVDERDIHSVATTFESPHDSLPEPLVAIWEPHSHRILLRSFEARDHSLRRILLNTQVKKVKPKNKSALFNVNTKADAEIALQLLYK